jgi:hypothetical protein
MSGGEPAQVSEARAGVLREMRKGLSPPRGEICVVTEPSFLNFVNQSRGKAA